MKYKFKFLYLIILIFISSCKDDLNYTVVTAGKHDSTYLYREFVPPFVVKVELDTAINFYSGMDSLDINLDGNIDIVISTRFNSNGSASKIDGKYIYPFYKLYLSNGFEVAVQTMNYACGHGYCNWKDFIAAIDYGTNISHFANWSESETEQVLWIEAPDGVDYPHGWWTRINNEETYIGIRKKEKGLKNKIYYKYGWIKVNALSLKNVSVTSYAIE